ncbi:MAG TPA: hypothetical protein EYG73_10085 [Arcobacter sp.]|nr:hypothetical protein [Arcobacter sp.]
MGLVQTIKFSDFNNDELFRMDAKFHFLNKRFGWNIFDTKNRNLISLKDILVPNCKIFKYENDEEYKGIPTGRDHLNEFGDIISYQVVTKDEHPNRLKYKVNSNCILISSLKGAKTPALSFDFDLSNYVFSNGFYVFEVSKQWNKKFMLYLLRTKTIKHILDNHIYRGIGISSYKENDLLKVQIQNINLQIQNKVIEKIKPIEKEIETLKTEKEDTLEIISDVFLKEFNINFEEVEKLDNTKQFNLKLKHTILKNDLLRASFKWHKLEIIQSYMYKDIKCIEKLSKFIISTKNGWSPQSSEVEEGTPILGQEHILKNGQISLSASKFTILTRNNIENFYIKKNDFFVSRGNTVELVALAGLVTDDIEDDILYPDLYIKIDFDEKYIDKQYMAYLFNSFFGRIYFKHVAKGKNQTMVKVSSKELYDFHVPLPNKTIQQEIINKIKTQIDLQKDIDKQIKNKQDEISKIIEDSIKCDAE